MLQICNGNFFFTDKFYETTQRAPLYTNIIIPDQGFDFCIGKALPTSRFLSITTIIFEVIEKQPSEHPDGDASVFISTLGGDIMRDLSYVFSFFFKGVCTTSYPLAERLLRNDKIPGSWKKAGEYVSNYFKNPQYATQEQIDDFCIFINKLINSPREKYEKSIKAISQFVVAINRIADDLDASYTLFVASIESLSQDMAEGDTDWPDVATSKRQSLDKILNKLEHSTANLIRNEIVKHEHLALSRKFVLASVNSLGKDFFNSEGKDYKTCGKSAIQIAIKNAYNLRSKYVHTLKPLPSEISYPHNLDYCVDIDGKPNLTLNGLSSVAREVILKFVKDMPSINEKEEIDYMKFIPGIMFARLSETLWMGNTASLGSDNYLLILDAILNRIEVLLTNGKADIPNMTEVINEVGHRLASENNEENILLMLSIVITLSNYTKYKMDEKFIKNYKKHEQKLSKENIYTLLLHTLCNLEINNADLFLLSFESYLETKYHKKKLRLSEFYESLLCAKLANEFYSAGEYEKTDALLNHIELNTPNSVVKSYHFNEKGEHRFEIQRYLTLTNKE